MDGWTKVHNEWTIQQVLIYFFFVYLHQGFRDSQLKGMKVTILFCLNNRIDHHWSSRHLVENTPRPMDMYSVHTSLSFRTFVSISWQLLKRNTYTICVNRSCTAQVYASPDRAIYIASAMKRIKIGCVRFHTFEKIHQHTHTLFYLIRIPEKKTSNFRCDYESP